MIDREMLRYVSSIENIAFLIGSFAALGVGVVAWVTAENALHLGISILFFVLGGALLVCSIITVFCDVKLYKLGMRRGKDGKLAWHEEKAVW